jgi:hypothetical protein
MVVGGIDVCIFGHRWIPLQVLLHEEAQLL